MADEIDWLDLPGRWTYGVDRGGRIFFINDEEKSTSWVHPGTEAPIQSGHSSGPGLPKGWEMDSTKEGAVYFINHCQGHLELTWSFLQLLCGSSCLWPWCCKSIFGGRGPDEERAQEPLVKRADRAILTLPCHYSTTVGLVDFFLNPKDLARCHLFLTNKNSLLGPRVLSGSLLKHPL
ncbi:Hypothetical predicted protein [Marmota monax]|uniref:WW domain-containing protein n=1 Tax=Marmota monax TaxID=9995 RepID=A0A5E4C6P0_MARMO|nr:hypothetical protein GHT09_017105 [Marmota monax]VTJ77508.1 Hypothetical predicted protein [Marmota monax]